MARKKHLINVHTSTGTTAPSGASLYLGEIAVQHTSGSPALWIKVGATEESTDYEKFVGETEIINEFNKTNHNIPYVVQSGDTYTGSTDAYVAESLELLELTEGQSIIFHPNQASKTGNSVSSMLSSCTLDIKLADGTMTGPHRLYLRANTKITTHIAGCSDIKLTYHENATWSGTTGLSGWWVDFYYDSNSDVRAHNLYYGNAQRTITGNTLGRYRLMLSSADNEHWVPINTTTATSATAAKTVTSVPIDPFGPIAYYSTTTTVATGTSPSASYTNTKVSALTIGYSYVVTLTSKLPVYLKCAPQSDGSAIIDSTTPFVQSLPTTEDGKIYIFLGVAASSGTCELYETHPVYEYKYGHIRQYQEDNAPEMILGSAYTYSGLSYVNSSTTIAAAYSALTNEMIKDERVTAAALNELNGRVNELSGNSDSIIEFIQENEEVVAGALNVLNDRLGTVETHMTGDYIPLTGYELASGITEEELTLSEEDTVNEAFGKLQKQMLDNEEAIAAGMNYLNEKVDSAFTAIAQNTGVTALSGAVVNLSAATRALSAGTDYWFGQVYNNFNNYTYTSTTSNLSGAVMSISAKTSGVLTINANGVQQGKYSPSANTTIDLQIIQEVTGADVLLTGYELATGTTEEELAIVATDTVNEAFGKLQKQNYDNEAVIAGSINDLDERICALEANSGASADLEALSGAVKSKEYVIAQALNDLNSRIEEISGNTSMTITIPSFSAADEGKVLAISGGTLMWVSPANL